VIIAGILLAAGGGTRFGGNKLEADFRGDMLGVHAAQTLATLGLDYRFAVHDPENAKLGAAYSAAGFTLIANNSPDAGQGHSIALAAQATLETDAMHMLVALADMPFVTADHLRRVIEAGGDDVIASAIGPIPMPPALFPRHLFSALACLSGDMGARALLKNAILIPGDAEMLADIDTQTDLARWR
jgi:molybdenum cofactor cytidylyltransferase